MSFSAMRGRCQGPYALVQSELAMGLDSTLFILSAWRNERRSHPDLWLPRCVQTELWLEKGDDQQFPVLHKEYHTTWGVLKTLVKKTDDWSHGNFVPFMDDYQVPRAIKPLVTTWTT